MKYLLDTHALLWWLSDNPKLSLEARKIIADSSNLIFVSAVSVWEISIKKALGKLQAPDNLEEVIQANNFLPQVIIFAHALEAGALPQYHLDPFDRMLIAQARIEQMTIITRDEKFPQYDVSIVSA